MLIMMNLQNLALRPNCLLTQSQLVFISGPRSLFFYDNPFGDLPEYLYEHGYRTLILPLPFRNSLQRKDQFNKWLLQNQNETFHFVLDEFTFEEFESVLIGSFVKSLTVLTAKTAEIHPAKSNQHLFQTFQDVKLFPIPIGFYIHRLFCFLQNRKTGPYSLTFRNAKTSAFERFLDHCIKLAENELYA